MSHAILSPSGASRWLACTPSARLEQQFPEKTSAFAEEGTLAHSLGELIIRFRLGHINTKKFKKDLAEIEASEHYCESMYEYCDEYATYVNEQVNSLSNPVILLEQKLDMTEYVPEGFGTGDVVIVSGNKLVLIDLKYGKGVPVYADNNKQLMLYALGALKEFDWMYDITEVTMIIYQPRINNISSFELSVDELRQWAETELRPKAELAFAGEGEYVAGNHCQFCKAKAVCKALADKNLELAKYDFKDPTLLTDKEISDILNRADLFTNWISSIEVYALDEALNQGKTWPGYKLVEGRSNRKIADPIKAVKVLMEKGFASEQILTAKLKGITELEKEIGKKEFSLYLSDLIIKPAGKPCLVPASDKRPELNSLESAKLDFANI
jgi:hypothetical protein